MEELQLDEVVAQVRKQAAGGRGVRCAVCATEAYGSLSACKVCGTTYHADCWIYNGGCAVYGCRAAPAPDEPLHIAIGEVWPRGARALLLAVGALAFLLVGIYLGERSASARIVEEVFDDADLPATVEVFADAGPIEVLRTVPLRHVPAARLRGVLEDSLGQDSTSSVVIEAEAGENRLLIRGPEIDVARLQRAARDLDVSTEGF